MLTIDLPAGSYLLFGKVEFVNPGANTSAETIDCRLGDDFAGLGLQTLQPNTAASIDARSMLTLSSAGTVKLSCSIGFGNVTEHVVARNSVAIQAISLGSIVTP